MSTSRSMTPLSVVLERLREKEYGRELIIKSEGAYFEGQPTVYQPSSLTIIKVYRFEGESDPADMSVIYAIRADDGQKGYLLNAYGTYSDQDNPFYDDFIRDVPVNEQEDL
ncbi:hypothetical protein [Parapedobacter indicus]|uniref:Phosphoribosylpyrophosphate synthetase n=1 Tax=Parapedobacter indicus TaxID=1477437 RepID=A0A1I3ID94_9SPHI|nr:hypothetical protein [Parapedobacter indicus]PPL02118.1 hypothetical protein CLV26_10443 [Parapedobacter indicus]SFI45954.1 hypothetical protein SAMN05444682_10443 [Parapedobacter indicus]